MVVVVGGGGDGKVNVQTLAQYKNKTTSLMLYSRVSQHESNVRFFNVFIIRQAHLRPNVPKRARFRRSLQNSQAEIELWANFLALRWDKTIQYRALIFEVRFLCPSSSKHNFTVSLKKYTVFELFHLQNPNFYLFCKCAQSHKRISNKGQIWKQHYQISIKQFKPLLIIISWT